jgi:hypothetical protein
MIVQQVIHMDTVLLIIIEQKMRPKVKNFFTRFTRYFNIAIDTLNQLKMEHKTIKVSYARPKCDETRGTNLYIRNLPGKMNLYKLFLLFILQINMMKIN